MCIYIMYIYTVVLRAHVRYLLFKVSSVLFVHQHQIKEIAYRELLVDIPHGGRQVISCKETEDVIRCHSNSNKK